MPFHLLKMHHSKKERSIVAKWDLLMETCDMALQDQQIEPILLGGNV